MNLGQGEGAHSAYGPLEGTTYSVCSTVFPSSYSILLSPQPCAELLLYSLTSVWWCLCFGCAIYPHSHTYICVCVCVCVCGAQSCPTLLRPHELQPARFLCPWDFPGKNTRVGCHFLLQEIFPSQGSNPGLLHWQADSLSLSHLGSPIHTHIYLNIHIYMHMHKYLCTRPHTYVFGCAGSSLRAEDFLWSQCAGSLVVARGLSCPTACGILVPQHGSNPRPLHWKADS